MLRTRRKLILVSVMVVAAVCLHLLNARYADRHGFGFVTAFIEGRERLDDPAGWLHDRIFRHLDIPASTISVSRSSHQSTDMYWFAIDGNEDQWKALIGQMRFAVESGAGTRIWSVRPVGDTDVNGSNVAPTWWPAPSSARFETWEFLSSQDREQKDPVGILFRIGYDASTDRIYLFK